MNRSLFSDILATSAISYMYSQMLCTLQFHLRLRFKPFHEGSNQKSRLLIDLNFDLCFREMCVNITEQKSIESNVIYVLVRLRTFRITLAFATCFTKLK